MFAVVDSFRTLRVFGLYVLGGALLLLALGFWLHNRESGKVLRGAGLYGVVGRMGGGKSYFMVKAALEALASGRVVYANFGLEGAKRFNSWADLLAVPLEDKALILIDEAGRWWPSEAWKAPTEVREWVTNIRKQRQTVLWAAQDVKQVSRWLRDLSFGIWECKRWRSGHMYQLYDAGEYFRSRAAKPELKVVVKRSKKVQDAYDTFELVESSVEWGGSDIGYAVSELKVRG